jgi:methionyl-tRNA formyltransferase
VAELAEKHGIPLLQPPSAKDEALMAHLRELDADVFLVVAYGELLLQEFLDLPRIDCLNVHPSLLPRHRGASPIPAAILAGDRITGTSIQRVVKKLDAGDVLVQKRLEIRPGETAGELAQRLVELSADAALEALDKVARGELDYTPQDPEQATFCKKLTKDMGNMDWARPTDELERHVRAMNPWPLARTTLPNGKGLGVRRARIAEGDPTDAAPGTLLAAAGSFLVRCGDGMLELLEVQADGKRPMDGADFLRGARLEAGHLLGASE